VCASRKIQNRIQRIEPSPTKRFFGKRTQTQIKVSFSLSLSFFSSIMVGVFPLLRLCILFWTWFVNDWLCDCGERITFIKDSYFTWNLLCEWLTLWLRTGKCVFLVLRHKVFFKLNTAVQNHDLFVGPGWIVFPFKTGEHFSINLLWNHDELKIIWKCASIAALLRALLNESIRVLRISSVFSFFPAY